MTGAPAPASWGEFARFLAAGGVAALTNLGVRWLIDFALPFEAAVALAYLAGMVVAFLLFQRAIFRVSGRGGTGRSIVRFSAVNAAGFLIALGVSSAMARVVLPALGWSFHPYETAHLAGVAAPALSSYFGHKYWTFR